MKMIRVLLVDDESSFLVAAQKYLKKENQELEVVTTTSSKNALEKLKEEENGFDCVVSDYHMPSINGLELLKKVKKDLDKDIPFIIFTSKGREEIAMEALNNGANRYIKKEGKTPSQFGVLIDAIQQEVEYYQAQKEARELRSLRNAILEVNQAIARGNSIEKVCEKACKSLVETEGYLDVSIALRKNNKIRPEASYGNHERKKWKVKLQESSTKKKEKGKVKGKGKDKGSYVGKNEDERDGDVESYIEVQKGPSCFKEVIKSEKKLIIRDKEDSSYCGNCEYCLYNENHKTVKLPMKQEFSRNSLSGVVSVCMEKERDIGESDLNLLKDVTEDLRQGINKLRLKQELQEERQRFEAIFDNVNDAIYLHELTEEGMPGKFIEVNDVASEMLGYSKKEFLEMSPRDIDSSEKTDEVPEIMEELLEEGDFRFEMKHQTKNGDEIPVEIHSHLFEFKGEKRVLSVARDITEQKELEEELRESERKFRGIFKASPDPVFLLDEEGIFVNVNETALQILGFAEEEIIGSSIGEVPFFPEEAVEKAIQKFERRKNGKEIPPYPLELETKDGKRIIIEVNVGTLKKGGFEGEIVIGRDITEKKEIEEREDFLHSLLRHDVRNKLQIIQGYNELLEEFDLPREANKYVSKGREGAKEANEIIEKVKNLREAQKENMKKVRIDTAVHEAIDKVKPRAEEMDIEIEANCPGEGCTILGGSLLDRIFSNLLENAIQHSKANKIKIHGKETEDEVVCIIEDDGKGIPEEEKEKIFDRGYTTDKERGTGLGLFLVKTLINTYNGTIKTKDSELGGARFDVYLRKA